MSLIVVVLKAENVPKEKLGSKSDPYAQLEYQGIKLKTKVVKESENPEWNETLQFDLNGKPLDSNESLVVKVRDWERVGNDKLLGQTSVPAREIISRGSYEVELQLNDANGRPTTISVSLRINYKTPGGQKGATPQAQTSSGATSASPGGGGGGSGEVKDQPAGQSGGTSQGAAAADATASEGGQPQSDANPDAAENPDEHEEEGDGGAEGGEGDAADGGGGGGGVAAPRRRRRAKDRGQLSTQPQDFQVRVKILCAKQLEGANVHPVCKVSVLHETRCTRIKRSTSSPNWNEIFYFSSRIAPAEIVNEMIKFEVYNSRKLRSDALIGAFQCDLGMVYDSENHVVLNKWLVLADTDDSQSNVKGYLKICLAIIAAGESAPVFGSIGSPSFKDATSAEEDIEANLLMPAGTVLQPATFCVKIYKAEDLPRMDTNIMENVKKVFSIGQKKSKELVDPYAIASYAGKKQQTKIIYERYEPDWNQELQLGFRFPSVADNIQFKMMDWDRITAHDVIATTLLNIPSISRKGEGGYLPTFGPCFVNFYGSVREFSELGDENEDLNLGRGEGVAYRGRLLLELSTNLGTLPESTVPTDIPGEDTMRVQKFMRRHKYMLHVSFYDATMMGEVDGPVEFEVSIGSYGNKLDDTVHPCASTSYPSNAVFDGCHYYFLPWESRKPCVVVDSDWEDISFRTDAINFLEALATNLDEAITSIRLAMKNNSDEVVSLCGELLTYVQSECSKSVPHAGPTQLCNDLDNLRYAGRCTELKGIIESAAKLQGKNASPEDILSECEGFVDTIWSLAVEPQNCIPDVFIWMLEGSKRRAYYRLPAHHVLYSAAGYNGKHCGRLQTVMLKYPGKKGFTSWKIPAKLRLKIWLGRKDYEDGWRGMQTDTVAVMAETYENQVSLAGSWTTKGPLMTRPKFSDANGDIALPKEAFVPPAGWKWDGDWLVSPELSMIYGLDAGLKKFTDDVYEIQTRLPGTEWGSLSVSWVNQMNDPMPSKDEIQAPDGWKWDDAWQADLNRAVDDEGWEYCIEQTLGGYGPVQKTYHVCRRKRWTRSRTMVADAKAIKEKAKKSLSASEGWEYASMFNLKFHAIEQKKHFVRRRRWLRKMVPVDGKPSACFFSFSPVQDDSEKKKKSDAQEKDAVAKQLAAPRMFLDAKERTRFQLRAYMYQARGLPASDDNSFSDPYAVVSFVTQSQKTEVKKVSLSPTWDQTLIFEEVSIYSTPQMVQEMPPDIVVEIFDEDMIGKDEFLGRVSAQPLVKLDPSKSDPVQLQWYEVKNRDASAGELLAAFELLQVTDKDLPFAPPRRGNLYMVPPGIRPLLRRTGVEILCWGMRNMKKHQLLPINSPSIEFEIGGTVVKSAVIKHMKKNPNFSEALLFVDTMLPKDDYFMPPINIRVRDNRPFGRKPTVGAHVVKALDRYGKLTSILSHLRGGNNGAPRRDEYTAIDLNDAPALPPKEEKEGTDEDWWSKYYASMGDVERSKNYVAQGLDTLKIYDKELEKAEDFNEFCDFCDTFPVYAGDGTNNQDLIDQEVVGEFKGSFRIYELPESPSDPMPPRQLSNLPKSGLVECLVRVYVVLAYDLEPSDPNGLADPYLIVQLGKRKISTRDEYHPNTLNPIFGKKFELTAMLPLEKDLKITVKDFDLLTSDDLIGETVIDLENRYLSQYRATCGLPKSYCVSGANMWRDSQPPTEILRTVCERHGLGEPVFNGSSSVSVGNRVYYLSAFEGSATPNPCWGNAAERLALHVLNSMPLVKEHIETRSLYSPLQPSFEQGKLQCWVDVFPKALGTPGPALDITPRRPKKFVLRCVIWNTTDVILEETNVLGERMSDIYVKGWLPGSEKQKTDVHYRSLDGDGNFNWRFVFPFEYLPAEQLLVSTKKEHFWSLDKTEERVKPDFSLQIWDNDIFSPDDFLGMVVLDLNSLPMPAKTSESCNLQVLSEFNHQRKTVSLFEQKRLRGFWPCFVNANGTPQLTGKVEMELEIVNEQEAEERPAGVARDEPNMNPMLDPPNRPATSFFWFSSPLKACRHIIWRRFKWYFIIGIILLFFIALIIIFLYTLPGNVWAKVFSG